MTRIKAIGGKEDVAAEHHHVVDGVLETFGQVRGPFSMLLHSPNLAAKILPLVPFVRDECIVKPNLRFPAILTAACENDASYVWAAQVGQARKAGIREDLIDLVRAKDDTGKLPLEEREIVEYARQLLRNHRVEQATFDALKKRHGEQWLVELTATIGYFGFVSGIANAFEVAAPSDGDRIDKS